jgi:molybdate transport system substrate-binding protein
MNNRGIAFIMFLILIVPVCGCGNGKTERAPVTVAAAANMQFALEALTKEFTLKTGVPCELIIGSSGKLTAQISEGAPYDLFVSANMKYPEALALNGMAALPPRHLADGALVLWTANEQLEPSLEALQNATVRHIALANPKTAPYGQAAMEVLENKGIFAKLKDKLVFGESIAQTNQFISSGSVEIGFTALSVVLSGELKKQGKWVLISQEYYNPVEQGILLLKKKSGINPEARELYDFLVSDDAGLVLQKFGYSVHE